jgi:hypothetical protein
MKLFRLLCTVITLGVFAAAAYAADPSGTWTWTTTSPNGELHTTLKLESKDGKLSGNYSNEFGAATISNASLKDGVIAFDVEREMDGNKFVVKYHGKLEGDTIKGTIEVATPEGGDPMKLEWNAKRATAEKK